MREQYRTFGFHMHRALMPVGIEEPPVFQRFAQSQLSRTLLVDPGYVSRVLRTFEQRGVIERVPSPTDARQQHVQLTRHGQQAFEELNDRTNREIDALLEPLSIQGRQRLLDAMRTIEEVLAPVHEEES